MEQAELFAPLSKEKLSDIIVDRIKTQIVTGELKPGDKLPTEMEFVEALGISRNVVREAIKVLEASGLVEIRRADGTYIVEEYSQKMLDPIIYGIMLSNKNMNEMLDFFGVVLYGALFLDRIHMTQDDLQELNRIYKALCDCAAASEIDVDQMFHYSTKFYRFCCAATHNEMLLLVYSTVLDILSYARRQGFENAALQGRLELHIHNYQLIMAYLNEESDEPLDQVCSEILAAWKTVLL